MGPMGVRATSPPRCDYTSRVRFTQTYRDGRGSQEVSIAPSLDSNRLRIGRNGPIHVIALWAAVQTLPSQSSCALVPCRSCSRAEMLGRGAQEQRLPQPNGAPGRAVRHSGPARQPKHPPAQPHCACGRRCCAPCSSVTAAARLEASSRSPCKGQKATNTTRNSTPRNTSLRATARLGRTGRLQQACDPAFEASGHWLRDGRKRGRPRAQSVAAMSQSILLPKKWVDGPV